MLSKTRVGLGNDRLWLISREAGSHRQRVTSDRSRSHQAVHRAVAQLSMACIIDAPGHWATPSAKPIRERR